MVLVALVYNKLLEMADNDAARANFEELKGHIDLASKRVRALAPGTESHTQTLEDLEDYYERTVQLRKIQADTAIEERNEALASGARAQFKFFVVIILLLTVVVGEFIFLAPESATEVWTSVLLPYATFDRLLMFCVTVFALLKLK